MRTGRHDDEGFTLIELLVVIIIIGILAAIAIPVFLNQRKKGYDAQVRADIHNATTALETYAADYSGALPPSFTSGQDRDLQAAAAGDGFTVIRSGNDRGLTVKVTAGAGGVSGLATATYLIAGLSDSGNQFCYDSNGGGKGIYAATTAAAGTTAGC